MSQRKIILACYFSTLGGPAGALSASKYREYDVMVWTTYIYAPSVAVVLRWGVKAQGPTVKTVKFIASRV
jgi:hypothetical protein